MEENTQGGPSDNDHDDSPGIAVVLTECDGTHTENTTTATTPKRRKMPETAHHMNGYANGHAPPELQQDTTFLFTSESVGEGHPGERDSDVIGIIATPIPPELSHSDVTLGSSFRLFLSISLLPSLPLPISLFLFVLSASLYHVTTTRECVVVRRHRREKIRFRNRMRATRTHTSSADSFLFVSTIHRL